MSDFENELQANADLHFERLFPPVRQEKAIESALIEIANALGCECSELRQMVAFQTAIDARAAAFRAAHEENPLAVTDIDNGWPKGAQPDPVPQGLLQRVAALEAGARHEDVPDHLSDLFDASLTPRQNHDKLQRKYIILKNEEEYARFHNDMQTAMAKLREAQRVESGITWNRPRLAEQV